MNRHDARCARGPLWPGWTTLPQHGIFLPRADRVPLLALFLFLGMRGLRAPLWATGALTEAVWTRAGVAWDAPTLRAIHQIATPGLDRRAVAVTTADGARGVAPLCLRALGVPIAHRRRRAAIFVALAYGGALTLDALAKAAFHSVRPHLWASPAPALGYGFPRGHAIGSLGLLAARVILAWPTRWRWSALTVGGVAVALIRFAHLYRGVHDPSDVRGAWAASLAWVVGLRLILAAPRVPRPTRHGRSASTTADAAAPQATGVATRMARIGGRR